MYPLIDIHTHRKEPDAAALRSIRLGTDDVPSDGSSFSAGIHPWDSEKADPQGLRQLETLPCAAIGEIGLDYAVSVDRTAQYAWLVRQLEIACKRGLPVILHCVKAYNEMLPILRPFDIPAVFHGFTGSEQLAGQVLKAGHYLSFGETAFRSSHTLKGVLLNLSLTSQARVISELTEVLRARQANEQIGPLFDQAEMAYRQLTAVIEDLLGKKEQS